MRELLAILALSIWLPANADLLTVNQFGGINTDDSPLTLQGMTPDSENVVTDNGPGVQGRKGFIIFSTQTPTGLWEFPKSDGTRYLISKSGGNLKADTGSGAFTTQVSTIPTDRTVAGSVLGDKFFFSDSLNGLKYWDGTSVTAVSSTLKFDKLATWKGRLAGAGISASQRVIYLSRYLDGTDFTLETNPTDDGPSQITVAGALDENIQALYSSFQDKLMWFKKNSFGALYGSRRSNFTLRTFSDYIGVASPETIRDCDGLLRWLGNNRVVWEFDGATYKKISEPVDNMFALIAQGDSASKANTQTSEAHFEAGTQSPSGFLDTVTTPGSAYPKTVSFLDTTSSDFAAGTDSPSGWMDKGAAIAGTLELGRAPAVPYGDSSQSDFQAGTLSNTVANSRNEVTLTPTGAIGDSYITDAYSSDRYGCSAPNYLSQSWTATAAYEVVAIAVRIFREGSPGNFTLRLMSDNAGAPGSVLDSTTITSAGLGTWSFPDISTYTFTGRYFTTAGTKYWIQFYPVGTCDSSNNLHPLFGTVNTSERLYSDVYPTYTGAYRVQYSIVGNQYPASGSIVSQTFDMGFTTNTWLWNWGNFYANSSVPTGTSISYQTQTSADGTNWDALVDVPNNTNPTSTPRRYIRYKASLATSDSWATPTLYDATLYEGDRIRPAATFISRTFDSTFPNPIWGVQYWDYSSSGSGSITLYNQASSDGNSWDSRTVLTHDSALSANRKRYWRYQADFVVASPTAHYIVNSFGASAISTGTWTSAAIPIGSQISSWGPLSASFDNNGGSYVMQFATSTNGSTFGTWTTVANNAVPALSTAPYAAVRFIYSLSIATQTPTLYDVTINWTEGSVVRAASAYSNQRYWLSVAVGGNSNNRIYLYDKNHQWQRYNGISADAMSLYNSKLYFGNSSGTFEAENGYSDNGSAIVAYYRTPTLSPNKLDLFSHWDYLYMTTDASDSVLASTFQINGIPTDYSMGSVAMNATTGIQNFKLPFPMSEIQTGKNINFKWGVSGTSFWRINNANLYFQPLILPE